MRGREETRVGAGVVGVGRYLERRGTDDVSAAEKREDHCNRKLVERIECGKNYNSKAANARADKTMGCIQSSAGNHSSMEYAKSTIASNDVCT